jgi:hypothetical protein
MIRQMKMLKTLYAAGILMFTTTIVSAQTNLKHDIGIVLSTFDYNRIGIDYRVNLGENWKLRTGFIYGNRYSDYFYGGEIIAVTDSLVTERLNSFNGDFFTLKLGGERVLGNSMFSVTGDLLFGYNKSNSSHRNQYTKLDSTGYWSNLGYQDYESYFGIGDTTRAQITRHYFVPTIAIGIMMDVPIKDRFIFSLGISANMGTNFYLGSSNEIDPYNEFQTPSGWTIDLNSVISAGFRYRFGGKKKSS